LLGDVTWVEWLRVEVARERGEREWGGGAVRDPEEERLHCRQTDGAAQGAGRPRHQAGEISVHALRGVSLRIESGEYVALMGIRAAASRR
jgi:hypothetical protein